MQTISKKIDYQKRISFYQLKLCKVFVRYWYISWQFWIQSNPKNPWYFYTNICRSQDFDTLSLRYPLTDSQCPTKLLTKFRDSKKKSALFIIQLYNSYYIKFSSCKNEENVEVVYDVINVSCPVKPSCKQI